MTQYQDDIKAVAGLKEKQGSAWNAINPESAARMRAQNKFKTGLGHRQVHLGQDHARRHGRLRCRLVQVHPVAGLLASASSWPAEDDLNQGVLLLQRTPTAATFTSPVLDAWLRCAWSSVRCRTSRCTKKPPLAR